MFHICHCGNKEDNHNFRHAFEGKIPVRIKNSGFILDAKDFSEKTLSKCTVPNCNASKELHDTEIITHSYKPKKIRYRHVVFCLPPDTVCQWKAQNSYEHQSNDCSVTLENHDSVMTHHFTTSVLIKNRHKHDVIDILDPEDEDTKILW